MTELIEAPPAVKPINHWIGGGRYAGKSGRSGPVYNPAFDFEGDGDVDLADLFQFGQRLFLTGYTP